MQADIDAYFQMCDSTSIDVNGKKVKKPYTIEGLALALGMDRDSLLNYEKHENYKDFFGTVKLAKAKIQEQKVTNALIGKHNPAVSIFDLKNNHGYRDKTEVDNNVKVEPVQYKRMSDND